MRSSCLPFILAAALLASPSMAQPCIKVCSSANWDATHRSTRFTPTTLAILVPGLAEADVICRVELFCYTRNTTAVSMPVWIYDRAASGEPGTILGSGTMLVNTAAAAYGAQLVAALPANADYFIVFDNAIGNLAPPVAIGGTASPHYHGGPPNWSGPFVTAQWMYRVLCSSGTVGARFDKTGQGCPGVHGVPRIGNVGTPVIGSVFQVTLAQAPSRGPVAHMLGASPTQIGLDAIGAPGCTLEQTPLVTFGRTTGSTGAASFAYVLRDDPALLGARFYVQWVVIDTTANALGITVSQGGVATVGDF